MAEETLKLFLRFRDQQAQGVILVDSRSVYLQKNSETRQRQLQLTGVLQYNDSQDKLYQTLGKRSVQKFLQGYSSMFFLYGAAETGKTYTLLGDETNIEGIAAGQAGGIGYKDRGLVIRAMEQIFRKAKSQQKQKEYSIYCSCMEITKIKVSDLSEGNTKTRLRIQQNKSGWFTPVNLHYTPIRNLPQFLKYFKSILYLRQSQNSHLIFQIHLIQQDIINRSQQPIQSYITFVQLGFINHFQQLEQQQQMLTELNSLSLVLSKINNLHNIQQGFKESRLTRLLKQSICNSQNITLIGTLAKSNSYVENVETVNFLKMAKEPQFVHSNTTPRIHTIRKSRRSIKLKYQTSNDKQETNSYNGSSANTLKRRESYLQITKQSEGYDRVGYLIGERQENEEIIKELQGILGDLKSNKQQMQKKGKRERDELKGRVAGLKFNLNQLKEGEEITLKELSHKYQKFIEQYTTTKPTPLSENQRTATTIPSKRMFPQKHSSISVAKDHDYNKHNHHHSDIYHNQHLKNVRNLLDERDTKLNQTIRQHQRQVSTLQQQKNSLSLLIDPYKSSVYKQTLKQIRQLQKQIKSQERYIKQISKQNVDQYQLMKILSKHKYNVKPYGERIQRLLKDIQNVLKVDIDIKENGFKTKAESYLKTQAFIVRTHKSCNSSRIGLV